MWKKISQKKHWWVLLFLFGTALFFRLFRPSADLPADISWSNAITQDATWYTAPAVHKALGFPLLDPKLKGNLYQPLFVWWCYGFYLIFGVHYATNTLIATSFGFGCLLLLFLILYRHLPSSYSLQCAFFATALLAYNYTAIAYSRVPVLYTPSAFWILLVIFLWLEGKKRPWFYLLAWGVLFLGAWGIKVIVFMIAPVLLLAHFLLLSDSRQKYILAAVFLGGGTIFFIAWKTNYFSWALGLLLGKISGKPRSLWDWLFHLYTYGSTSRWFFRHPFLSVLPFLYLILFFLDRRPLRERILEVIFLGWFFALLFGTVFLDQRPLRFLSVNLYSMAALWALALEKFYALCRPISFLRRGWRHRFFSPPLQKITSSWRFWFSLSYFILAGSFLFYHFFAEILYFSHAGMVIGYTFSFNVLRHQYFEACFHLGVGVTMILAALWILFPSFVNRLFKRAAPYFFVAFLLLSIAWNLFLTSYHFLRFPLYSQYFASKQLPSIVGSFAHVKGAYAHALTLETNLQRSALFRLHLADPTPQSVSHYMERTLKFQKTNPLGFLFTVQDSRMFKFNRNFVETFKKQGVTHFALPPSRPNIKVIQTHFRRANAPLVSLYSFYIRGWEARVLRFCPSTKEPGFAYAIIRHRLQRFQHQIKDFDKNFRKKWPILPGRQGGQWVLYALYKGIELYYVASFYRQFLGWLLDLEQKIDKSNYSFFEKGVLSMRITNLLEEISKIARQFHLPLVEPVHRDKILKKAFSWFQENVKVYPYTPLTLAYMGEVAKRMGKYKEAESFLKVSLKENPYDAGVWLHLGKFYLEWAERTKETSEKIRLLEKAFQSFQKLSLFFPHIQKYKKKAQAIYQKIQKLKKNKSQ